MNRAMVEAYAASSDRSTREAARTLLDAGTRPVVVEAFVRAQHPAECECPACIYRAAIRGS